MLLLLQLLLLFDFLLSHFQRVISYMSEPIPNNAIITYTAFDFSITVRETVTPGFTTVCISVQSSVVVYCTLIAHIVIGLAAVITAIVHNTDAITNFVIASWKIRNLFSSSLAVSWLWLC